MIFEGIDLLTSKNSHLPKYAQLAEQMRTWINRKQVPPGTKLPNNRQLAKHFNVTPVTINRSLQELARKGLVDMKVGSGTFIAGNSKKANKTLRIGILCHVAPRHEDYYTSVVSNTFHAFWEKHPSDIISLVKSPKEYRKAIEEYSLDGVMVLAPQKEFEPEIIALHSEGFPIVSIGTKFNAPPNCSFGTDHAQAACNAVTYLADRGHRFIGAILPCQKYYSSSKRIIGYKNGMWKAQLPANPNWLINEQMHKDYGLEKAVADIMSTTPKPTALLVMAYLNIIPMYTILNKLGYKIPQDISLIAFDDPTFASQISPALTVFSQPIEQFTQKAAQSLLNQIKKENGGEIGNDCSYLIERESVLDISKTNKNQGQTK